MQRGEIRRHLRRQELRAEFFRVELCRLAEGAGEQIAERAGARGNEAAPDFARVVGDGDDVAADVLGAHAGRIGGADQRADRGAGDGGGLDAHLVERLEHRDMGEAAGAAAAEREGETLHAGCALIFRWRFLPLWRRCYGRHAGAMSVSAKSSPLKRSRAPHDLARA